MTPPDRGLSAYFTRQHREADGFWAAVEEAVAEADASQVSVALARFDRSMRQHLASEEEVLFPAFEQATGIVQGPTMVMRAEHRQMRALLDQMRGANEAGDHKTLLDVGDTLLTFTQQHNMKEEGMLYRMSEQVLGTNWSALRECLQPYV